MSVKIDLNAYYRQKKASIDWYYGQGRQDAGYTISTLSCYTFLPCIVLTCWIGEERGFDDYLLNKLNEFIKFYGYSEIIGLPENCPRDRIKYRET